MGFLFFFCFFSVPAEFIYVSTTIIDWIFNEAIGIIRYNLISLDIKKEHELYMHIWMHLRIKHYFPTKWNSNAFSNHENLEWTMHRWKHLLIITPSIIFWHMQLDINKNDTHLIFSWKYMTIWSHKQFKSTAP